MARRRAHSSRPRRGHSDRPLGSPRRTGSGNLGSARVAAPLGRGGEPVSRLSTSEVDAIERECQRITRRKPFGNGEDVVAFVLLPEQFYRLTIGARAMIDAEREA